MVRFSIRNHRYDLQAHGALISDNTVLQKTVHFILAMLNFAIWSRLILHTELSIPNLFG